MVLRSVGYRSAPLPGVPFDESSAIVPNAEGRVLGVGGYPRPSEYVAGWLKRGLTGVIGTNKSDAAQTVRSLQRGSCDVVREKLQLAHRGVGLGRRVRGARGQANIGHTCGDVDPDQAGGSAGCGLGQECRGDRVAAQVRIAIRGERGVLAAEPAWVIANEGITSHDVALHGLGIRRAEVVGQLFPGLISLFRPVDAAPQAIGMPYIVFPGNVGDDQALAQVVALLNGEQQDR
jgi:hypothetical protein